MADSDVDGLDMDAEDAARRYERERGGLTTVETMTRVWGEHVRGEAGTIVSPDSDGHVITLRQVQCRDLRILSLDGWRWEEVWYDVYEFVSGNTSREATPQGRQVLMTEEIFEQIMSEVADCRRLNRKPEPKAED